MSAMTNLVFVRAAARFAGLIEDSAADIVKPAVIEATQPAVFDASVTQVGAPMRAMQPDQTQPALIVAKQHQFFAEDFNLQRRPVLRQFLAKRDGLPIAPQKLAAGVCGSV